MGPPHYHVVVALASLRTVAGAWTMFEKSLTTLIKGLRSHRGKDEAKYIASMLDEIRTEVKSADMDVKAEAVLKLAYLRMLGYEVKSASFSMLEAMASSKYHVKHIGYLAAALCFSEDTEVLILATNLIKKVRRPTHTGPALGRSARRARSAEWTLACHYTGTRTAPLGGHRRDAHPLPRARPQTRRARALLGDRQVPGTLGPHLGARA